MESAGLWACSECSDSRNFASREACYKCGARRVEPSTSPRRRDRKSQESRSHGRRPRSFVEVLKAEASKFVPAMAAASTTVQDSSAEMDTSAQQGEIKQRLNEPDKIISKLEDVGDPALADLVAAGKAEKETLRGRLQESSRRRSDSNWPRMHGTRLHANIVKLERSWRRCDCSRESAGLAGRDVGTRAGSAGSGYVGCQIAARARASQRGYDADAWDVPWYAPALGVRFSRSFAARGCQAVPVVAWLGVIGGDGASVAGECRRWPGMRSGRPRYAVELRVISAVSFRVVPGCSGVCSLPGCRSKNSQGSLHAAASSWRSETRVKGRGPARDAGPSGGLADPASDVGISAGSLRTTLGLVDPRSDPRPNCLTS